MADQPSPAPINLRITDQPSERVPAEVLKLYYRLRQLPNTLVLVEVNDKGEPVTLMPLARLERFAQTT